MTKALADLIAEAHTHRLCIALHDYTLQYGESRWVCVLYHVDEVTQVTVEAPEPAAALAKALKKATKGRV